jgi:hypothetical protein
MTRISERISAAIMGVRCPGCSKVVVPMRPEQSGATAAPPEGSGKRWSFVWRPPSGDVCPQCHFPLGRYARRLKWIRLFVAGIMFLAVDGLLVLIGAIRESPMPPGLVRALGLIGAIALILGLMGLIVGGRGDVDVGSAGS